LKAKTRPKLGTAESTGLFYSGAALLHRAARAQVSPAVLADQATQ